MKHVLHFPYVIIVCFIICAQDVSCITPPDFISLTNPANGKVVSLKDPSKSELQSSIYDPANYTHHWKLVRSGDAYQIKNKANQTLVLDVQGGNSNSGTAVGLWVNKTTGNINNQWWYVNETAPGSGLFTIETKLKKGLYLRVETTGSLIIHTTPTWFEVAGKAVSYNKTTNQLQYRDYDVNDLSQHWYYHSGFIVNRVKLVALDVEGSKKINGTKVIVYDRKDFSSTTKANQQWIRSFRNNGTQVNFETKLQSGLHLRYGNNGLYIGSEIFPGFSFYINYISDAVGLTIINKLKYFIYVYEGNSMTGLNEGDQVMLPYRSTSYVVELRDPWSLTTFMNITVMRGGNDTFVVEDYVDECVNNTVCHKNAACRDMVGKVQCSCKYGFTGNGTYCEDENECENEFHYSICPDYYECVNYEGDYGCLVVEQNIVGTVISGSTGMVIAGAALTGFGPNTVEYTATSHANGSFTLYNVNPDDLTGWNAFYISATAEGYHDYTETVDPEILQKYPGYAHTDLVVRMTPQNATRLKMVMGKWRYSRADIGFASPDGTCVYNSYNGSNTPFGSCSHCGVTYSYILAPIDPIITVIIHDLSLCASEGKQWRTWLVGDIYSGGGNQGSFNTFINDSYSWDLGYTYTCTLPDNCAEQECLYDLCFSVDSEGVITDI